jgi:hypothetical protein
VDVGFREWVNKDAAPDGTSVFSTYLAVEAPSFRSVGRSFAQRNRRRKAPIAGITYRIGELSLLTVSSVPPAFAGTLPALQLPTGELLSASEIRQWLDREHPLPEDVKE